MTNLLVWNIQKFSSPKITGPAGLPKRQVIQSVINAANRVTINRVVTPLDLIVIIEVTSPACGALAEGTVLGSMTSAGSAVLRLLGPTGLPRWQVIPIGGFTGWALVPPVMLGESARREAVAVFYNTATLQFLGPWFAQSQGYPDGTFVLSSVMQPPAPFQAYQGNAYGGVLPNTRPAPNGATENQLAGQWAFYTPPPGNNRIYFPYGYGGVSLNRAPFLTQFLELGGAGRTINLFSVHTTPGVPAAAAMRNFPAIPEAVPGARQVSVFAGDFNVDTFQAAPNLPGEYQAMVNMPTPYAMALDPRDATGAINLTRQPYCLTHLLPGGDATPFLPPAPPGQASPTANVYPRLGYLGGWGGVGNPPTDAGSIDNVLVAPGPVNAATAVNTVVGQPYNPAPPANAANLAIAGFPAFNPMAMPVQVPEGSDLAPAALGNFQFSANFPLIRSVSDHLPVYASF